MEELQPAGFWTRLFSAFLRKRLEVEVKIQHLDDGTIEVAPVFTVNGCVVRPDKLSRAPSQDVLGHYVTADPEVLSVLTQTGGKKARLSKNRAAEFIGQMTRRGIRFRSRTDAAPKVTEVKAELRLDLQHDDSLKITSDLVTPQGFIVEKPKTLDELSKDDGWFLAGEDLLRWKPTESTVDSIVLAEQSPSVLNGNDVPRFLQDVSRHPGRFSAIEKNEALSGLSIYGDKHENQLRVAGDKDSITLDPALVYFGKDNRPYQPPPEGIAQALQTGRGFNRIPEGWIEIRPEVVAEHSVAVNEITTKVGQGRVVGSRIPEILQQLVNPATFSTPWAVYFSTEVKNSHRLVDTPAETRFALNVVESNGRALLHLDPRYNHDRFRLDHGEVQEALEANQQWIRRNNAWIKIDRKRFESIAKAITDNGLERTSTGVQFPASRREEVLAIFSLLGSIEHSESYARFLEQLADFEEIEHAELPKSLRTSVMLRPYQQHGYNWLAFLRKYGLNGILADDMGLGKTLQTLAVVRMEQERDETDLPTLIICPTSLVANWKREAEKFFEGFEVKTYTGDGRSKVLTEIQRHSVEAQAMPMTAVRRNLLVITSFGIALRDQDHLSQIPWLYIIVDEAHNIKNPTAKRTRAIKTINGRYKLALTGTPIQNNLDELWTLFDFVMPGYLGSRGRFRAQYGNGKRVDWQAVHDDATGLRRRIHPFIMRRLKQTVATDLPEKIVVKLPVELSPAQVQLYKDVLKSAEFRKLVEAVDSKGVERAGTEILSIYTKLRLICNHPGLIDNINGPEFGVKESGKLAALEELIEEVKVGGHRSLVFSQSTKMLDIIADWFKEWDVSYLRLDGSTPPSLRQELVDEFNRDESLTAFLISTKAGGTGLNLTGADTVIFYDHDWNPANDNQAQDRAYRIGQKKNVTVYKLVSVGTIEEKIIERQELKQTLADQIVGADIEGFKDLSKEDLLGLFQFGH